MNDPHPIARDLRDALQRLMVAHGAMDATRRPCGATIPLPHAYALLSLRDGPLRVSALAERLRIDRTSVSRLCARMEAAGELMREVDPADARARQVRLTPAGVKAAAAIDRSSAAHFSQVTARLDAPAEVLAALETLTRALHAARTGD